MDKSDDVHIYAIVPRGLGKSRFAYLNGIEYSYRNGMMTKEQYEEAMSAALVLLFRLTPGEAMILLKHDQNIEDD